jgi:hypothetical protein
MNPQAADCIEAERYTLRIDEVTAIVPRVGFVLCLDRMEPTGVQEIPRPWTGSARWLDEVAFVQPFAESFESDEACFNAITGWAARIHRQGTAVRSIAIEEGGLPMQAPGRFFRRSRCR